MAFVDNCLLVGALDTVHNDARFLLPQAAVLYKDHPRLLAYFSMRVLDRNDQIVLELCLQAVQNSLGIKLEQDQHILRALDPYELVFAILHFKNVFQKSAIHNH